MGIAGRVPVVYVKCRAIGSWRDAAVIKNELAAGSYSRFTAITAGDFSVFSTIDLCPANEPSGHSPEGENLDGWGTKSWIPVSAGMTRKTSCGYCLSRRSQWGSFGSTVRGVVVFAMTILRA